MSSEDIYGPLMMYMGILIMMGTIISGNSMYYPYALFGESITPTLIEIVAPLFKQFWYGMGEDVLVNGIIFMMLLPYLAEYMIKMLGYIGVGFGLGKLFYPYFIQIQTAGLMEYTITVTMILIVAYQSGLIGWELVKRVYKVLFYGLFIKLVMDKR